MMTFIDLLKDVCLVTLSLSTIIFYLGYLMNAGWDEDIKEGG